MENSIPLLNSSAGFAFLVLRVPQQKSWVLPNSVPCFLLGGEKKLKQNQNLYQMGSDPIHVKNGVISGAPTNGRTYFQWPTGFSSSLQAEF